MNTANSTPAELIPNIDPETSSPKKEGKVRAQKELFFCFSNIVNCRNSKKTLQNNKSWYKKLVEGLFKFTTLFEERNKNNDNARKSLYGIGHMDYKKPQGTIKGYEYKFMLSQSHGVLTNETNHDNALIVHVGKLDNHHPH